MANKIRFDRKSIEEAAFKIVQTKGMDFLNARSLAFEINGSTQPIFSYFSSMDEVKETVLNRTINLFRSFTDKGLAEKNPVRGLALAIVRFVQTNPKLYPTLFIDSSNLLKVDIDHFGTILTSYISKQYNLPNKTAYIVFLENWLFISGISLQIYSGSLNMNEKGLIGLIDSELEGTIYAMKSMMNKR